MDIFDGDSGWSSIEELIKRDYSLGIGQQETTPKEHVPQQAFTLSRIFDATNDEEKLSTSRPDAFKIADKIFFRVNSVFSCAEDELPPSTLLLEDTVGNDLDIQGSQGELQSEDLYAHYKHTDEDQDIDSVLEKKLGKYEGNKEPSGISHRCCMCDEIIPRNNDSDRIKLRCQSCNQFRSSEASSQLAKSDHQPSDRSPDPFTQPEESSRRPLEPPNEACRPTSSELPYLPARKHPCSLCKKMFTTANKLLNHYRVIHCKPEKPASQGQCQHCGKVLTTPYGLILHVRYVHEGVRPFGCHICDKQFVTQTDLRVHTRIHTGEKPYICGKCGKMFSDKSNLRHHTKIHSDVCPFMCSKCGKGFKFKCSLESHEKAHEDTK